jgi:hypothetical protein
MPNSQVSENRETLFSAPVWKNMIMCGIQGENQPENQGGSHPILENRPTLLLTMY